jgi:7-cyano-7-deazaguanine synthase in queuosine biosynthesis
LKKILVLCNHTKEESIAIPSVPYDETLKINPTPPQKNLELHLYNLTHRILGELNPLGQDLLEIASYVYHADRSIKRGGETDVFGDNWKRHFHFVIPISNQDFWNAPEITDLLIETLEFVTDDRFSFTFSPPKPIKIQYHLPLLELPSPLADSSCVCLFSGGLDSLIGSLYLHKELNETPLLISHRSTSVMDSRQKRLVELIKERNQVWEFPHLSIWINREGERAKEETQRSRSFLYLSTAAAVANKIGVGRIYLCENGVVSLNIPLSAQNVGAFLTRGTNPKFLRSFEQLANTLFEGSISVANPFIFMTKTQMLEKLKEWNQGNLIQATVSCAYTQGKTKMQPQCGTCSQCLNRRFSVIASGMETYESNDGYEKDVFYDSLEDGRESTYAEGYVRTALEISEMNDFQLFSKYPELEEVVNCFSVSADQAGLSIYDLFQRHAEETINVATAMCNRRQRELISGKLPENCLVSILAQGRHLLNPIVVFVEKISRILTRSLRIAFQTEKPNKEIRLHEAAQAVFAAAGERLNRESPMLSYSLVRVVPDFSGGFDYDKHLFLEFKLVSNRQRLNQTVKEINASITSYRAQGAYVLFVVYDCNDYIADDERFVEDFERHENIKAIVIR